MPSTNTQFQRDRAWEVFPFPCIGVFDFLEFSLANRSRVYHKLVARLQAGETFLDVGCCFGHDIRKLIFDGAPAENLVGAELRQGYIDLGYDLFRDRARLKAKILQANVLDDITSGPWPDLVGKFDIVNFSMVLHVFPWDGQVAMLERGIQALKPAKLGTTMTGIACGNEDGLELDWDGKIPVHNPETFRKLVGEVEAKTGTRWEVKVELDNCWIVLDPRYEWMERGMRRLVFEMTRIA